MKNQEKSRQRFLQFSQKTIRINPEGKCYVTEPNRVS